MFKIEESVVENSTTKIPTQDGYVKNVSLINSQCLHIQHSYILSGTGHLMIYNQGKNSHWQPPSEMRPTQESPGISHHGAWGGGEEDRKRRPRTNGENGALGEHLSARYEQ